MFGLEVTNDFNEVLFTDSSYVLQYAGKAVWQQRYNLMHYGVTNSRYLTLVGYTIYSAPHFVINRMRVSVPSTELLAFSYVPSPSFTAILYTTAVDANTTDILVIAQEEEVPEVYCFRKIQPVAGGYGMQLRDAAGNITVTSNAQLLIPKAGAVIPVPYTNQYVKSWSRNSAYSFTTNGGDENNMYITSYAPIRSIPATVTKPAICYYTQATAVIESSTSSGNYGFIEHALRYNTTTKQFEGQHGLTALTYINSTSATIRVPAHSVFTMMIDGAFYD